MFFFWCLQMKNFLLLTIYGLTELPPKSELITDLLAVEIQIRRFQVNPLMVDILEQIKQQIPTKTLSNKRAREPIVISSDDDDETLTVNDIKDLVTQQKRDFAQQRQFDKDLEDLSEHMAQDSAYFKEQRKQLDLKFDLYYKAIHHNERIKSLRANAKRISDLLSAYDPGDDDDDEVYEDYSKTSTQILEMADRKLAESNSLFDQIKALVL